MKSAFFVCAGLALAAGSTCVSAAPVTYDIDPNHTHPGFEVDHPGGLSVWRGNFRKTTGTVVLDAAAKTGKVEIAIDTGSVDFANDALNADVKTAAMLDVPAFPTAVYTGRIEGFSNDTPSVVNGDLTLHGVTRPVSLTIDAFKCMQQPMLKKEVCGADARGSFNRDDFGIDFGKQYGRRLPTLE